MAIKIAAQRYQGCHRHTSDLMASSYSKDILWGVNTIMAYAPRDYLYLLTAGIIVIVAALWLSALDVDTDTILLLVGVCLGILVAGWVLGRNKKL